jgi:hypothetical protein
MWVPQSDTHIWYGTAYPERLCNGCNTTFDADPFGDLEWEERVPQRIKVTSTDD